MKVISLLLLMLTHISFYREENPLPHPLILHLLQRPSSLENKVNPSKIVAEDHRHMDTSHTAALLQHFALLIPTQRSQNEGIKKADWVA